MTTALETVPVTRQEYPAGVAGVRLSLTDMARRIREGAAAPTMQQFAEMVVRNWGRIPANVQVTNRQAAQILLDYVRSNVRYRPDPPGRELVKSAYVTLCVTGASVCVPVGDCDDLVTAFCTLAEAYGIPARIIKQTYGSADQEHVLAAIQDENGSWWPADPSVPDRPLGWKAAASHEDIIDPSDPATISSLGLAEAEFVGVGRLVAAGLGFVPAHRFIGQAPPAPTYQLLTDRKIYHGNHYRVGMLITFVGTPPVSADGQRGMILSRLQSDWTIEQLAPTGNVTGGIQSWILQGVAKNDFTLADTDFITYSAVAGQTPGPSGPTAPPPASNNVGVVKTALGFAALGLAAFFVAPKMFPRWGM